MVLVIHEAQQARVPVITANVGGMSEYVHHEINGLLFQHRDSDSLAQQMQRFVDNPEPAGKLGKRGYLFSETGDIPRIQKHAEAISQIYQKVIEHRDTARISSLNGPWRITFDTNPDTCNLYCIMCEEHSPTAKPDHTIVSNSKSHRVMPFELMKNVILESASNGLKEIIPSTMGEPLLYKNIDKVIDLCAELRIRLNLTTNGTFPGRGARSWAERIAPVRSDVKISINGASKKVQERIMVGSCWEVMMENIESFISVRNEHAESGNNYCRVTFQVTFMEENLDELPGIVQHAINLGVDRVKGHHLWIHNKSMKSQSLKRNASTVDRWNSTVKRIERLAENNLLPGGNRIQLGNFFPLESSSGSIKDYGHCPFLGQEAWINTVGRFSPCCAPDELRKSLGEFGNL